MDAIPQIIYQVFLIGAVYGAIRQDIKAMHRDIAAVQASTTRAHERIDTHLDRSVKP